jgi:hypothetical protein
METPQLDPWRPEIFSHEGIVQLAFEFEELVKQKQASLKLPPGSPIEAAGLAAMEMLETFRGNIPHDGQRDHRKEWRQAVALGDMLRKVMQATSHPSFDKIWPHVMLLLGTGNIALNMWNPREDSDANKIFELYMALVLAPLCPNLELDDPVHSSGGKNPDVIAQLDGSRWAFSCKVMHSDSPKTFIDRVEDGIRQIQRSDADKGIVVISLKNLLPHDDYWTAKRQSTLADYIYNSPIDHWPVVLHLLDICGSYDHQVINDLLGGSAAFNDLFKGTKVVPAVLLHLCTTVAAMANGKRSIHLLRMFRSLNGAPLPADVLATLERLNDSLHGRVTDVTALRDLQKGLMQQHLTGKVWGKGLS